MKNLNTNFKNSILVTDFVSYTNALVVCIEKYENVGLFKY